MRQTTTRVEKWLYALGDVGANFIWAFASSFLTLYYTDSVLVSAAYVGSMMLVTRIFDGISDILMGIVIEKTNTRWGKARPWLLFSSLPLVVTFLMVFRVPSSWDIDAKKLYIFITYFLMAVIMYTVNNLSYHAMLPRISLTQDDRNRTTAVRSSVSMVGVLVISVLTPALLNAFGGESSQSAWNKLTLIYGITALILLMGTFLGTKEKVPYKEKTEEKRKEPIKKGLKLLLHTKYFYAAVLIFVLHQLSSSVSTGIAIYYARDVLGNSSYYTILALSLILPLILIIPFAPKFVQRFGKQKVMMAGSVFVVLTTWIGFLNPQSLPLIMAVLILKGIGTAPTTMAMFTLAGDIVDYLEKKSGLRLEGLATAANSFGMKVGTGLGAALIGWILAAGNYDASLTVQPQSAINSEIILVLAIPIAAEVFKFIVLFLWDIEKEKNAHEKTSI